MSTVMPKWRQSNLIPLDWTALPWFQMMQSPVRIEERLDGQTYVLRAEMPGVDPEKDVEVTYHDGALRLQFTRADARKDKTHSEFHYGSYGRTVTLPASLDEKSIHASYLDGILEIEAKLAAPEKAERSIPITAGVAKRVNGGVKH